MSIDPKPGEVYFVDLGLAKKPRNILIVSVRDERAPLAVISGLSLTSHYHHSPYEVVLPSSPGCESRATSMPKA
jgi:mRNA interferase MazF